MSDPDVRQAHLPAGASPSAVVPRTQPVAQPNKGLNRVPELVPHSDGGGARGGLTPVDPIVGDVVEPRAWATVAVVAATGGLVALDTMVNIAFPAITAS